MGLLILPAMFVALLPTSACSKAPAQLSQPPKSEAGRPAELPPLRDGGTVEIHSAYSHILVDRQGSVVTLSFVRDSGEVMVESRMDVTRPHQLLVSYTQYMFASYFFKPEPRRILLVGLGGGSMVQFLRHYDPEVRVDVAEIDPDIVRIAAHYFGVRSEGNVRIFTVDGLKYLRETGDAYDVIYMDAFLKPSESTDASGVPRDLKTREFLNDVQKKLTPDGMVVFNLNSYDGLQQDIANIRGSFAETHFFKTATRNLIAVGLRTAQSSTPEQLHAAGQRLDERWQTTFSFADMSRQLVHP